LSKTAESVFGTFGITPHAGLKDEDDPKHDSTKAGPGELRLLIIGKIGSLQPLFRLDPTAKLGIDKSEDDEATKLDFELSAFGPCWQ
jgi:hypothetical protein